MKDLRNYIDLYELNESLLFESEEIVNETFIKDIADWFGSKFGAVSAKLKNLKGDIKNFGKDATAAYQGVLASLLDERNKKNNDKEKQEMLDKADNVDNFYNAGIEYIKNNSEKPESLEDSTFIYTTLLVKTIATQKKDEETLKMIEPIWNKIPSEAKKNAAEVRKEVVDNNIKKEETLENPEEKKEEKEVKKEVTDVINDNSDILGDLTKKAGIDPKKLRSYVVKQLQWVKGEDGKFQKNKTEEEIGEETILGTCVMVCGAYITQDPEAIERIAKRLNTTADELLKNI